MTTEQLTSKRAPASLNTQIGLLTAIRIVYNTAYRMVYPLLPVFGRGLGVDISLLSYTLTTRSAVSSAGIFLAPIADRYGRRVSMILGLTIFIIGAGCVLVSPNFTGFLLAMVLANLGVQIFVPAMQAYLADRIPYERLGRALGITEISWSLSAIVGIPVIAWLIGRFGWSAPFPVLFGLGLAALILILVLVPSDRPASGAARSALWSAFGQVLSSPMARIALLFALLTTIANEVVNFIFGVWMEDSFGLQLAALGAASAVIGVSELGGSSLSAALVDRVGKERSVAVGLGLNALAAVLLPVIGQSLTGALAGLFLFYLTFEFLLVSMLPLMSEIVPSARATMLALMIGMFAGGRALGDLLSPLLYAGGFWGNTLAAAALNLISLLLLRWIHPAGNSEAQEIR